jgi:hypothetical protein
LWLSSFLFFSPVHFLGIRKHLPLTSVVSILPSSVYYTAAAAQKTSDTFESLMTLPFAPFDDEVMLSNRRGCCWIYIARADRQGANIRRPSNISSVSLFIHSFIYLFIYIFI